MPRWTSSRTSASAWRTSERWSSSVAPPATCRRGSSPSTGWTHRSRPGNGCRSRSGAQAAPTSWDAVADLDPEMLLLVPRDADLAGTRAAWARAPRPPSWGEIHAARRGQVFALDAAAYFANPGPRVIDGIELLAELFDPAGFVDVAPPGGWVPVE